MVNRFVACLCAVFSLLVLSLTSNAVVAASLEATVERQTVIDGESVVLYIQGENLRELPDVSVLSHEFDVLDSRRSNNTVIEQGVQKSKFTMRFELLPKNLGQVEIPVFTADGESSQAIRIDVVERGTAGVAPRDKVFAEVTFDKENPYVQSQVIMSLHILDDGSLATLDPQPPVIPDVQVEILPVAGQRIEERDGVEYRVHTWRYALFPQRNGEIEIPRMQIAGSVKDPGYGGNLILRNIATRRISIRTKATKINVRAKPAASTADWWLPAEQLQLTHQWSSDIKNSVVGEPLTLTVALTAGGATSNQLPSIVVPEIEGLKIYPDVPELVSQPNDNRLISRRSEKWSVIPLQEGLITLPAVTLKWWDTNADVERSVSLPEQQLMVAAAAGNNLTGSQKPQFPVAVESADTNTNTSVEGQPPDKSSVPGVAMADETGDSESLSLLPRHSQLWMWIAIFALVGWLLTSIVWWLRSRRRNNANRAAKSKQADKSQDSSLRLRELRALSNSDNPAIFRDAIMDWAHCYWPAGGPVNLAEIGSRLHDSVLQDQLRQLDSSLYGKQPLQVSLSGIYATLSAALNEKQKQLADRPDPLPQL